MQRLKVFLHKLMFLSSLAIISLFIFAILFRAYIKYSAFSNSIVLEENSNIHFKAGLGSNKIEKDLLEVVSEVDELFDKKCESPLLFELLSTVEYETRLGSKAEASATAGFYDPRKFNLCGFHSISLPAEGYNRNVASHEYTHAIIEELNPNISTPLNEGLAHYVQFHTPLDALTIIPLLKSEPNELVSPTGTEIQNSVQKRGEGFVLVHYCLNSGMSLREIIQMSPSKAPSKDELQRYVSFELVPKLTSSIAIAQLKSNNWTIDFDELKVLFFRNMNEPFEVKPIMLTCAEAIGAIYHEKGTDLAPEELNLIFKNLLANHQLTEFLNQQKGVLFLRSRLAAALSINGIAKLALVAKVQDFNPDNNKLGKPKLDVSVDLDRLNLTNFELTNAINETKTYNEFLDTVDPIINMIKIYMEVKELAAPNFKINEILALRFNDDFGPVVLSALNGELSMTNVEE